MPFLHRPGCDLYYEVTGAGPAVVFAHGFGGNHLSWWQQVPHLAERYTCVTFSHRGFGPSGEDAGGPGPLPSSMTWAHCSIGSAWATSVWWPSRWVAGRAWAMRSAPPERCVAS